MQHCIFKIDYIVKRSSSFIFHSYISFYDYSIYCIFSTVDGYLDCFHLGAIINEVTRPLVIMSLGEHLSSFLLVMYLGVELLAHRYEIFSFSR